MATDNESARRARAEALRRQIDRLQGSGEAPPPPAPPPPPEPAPKETPAEFVRRRMRELDKGAKR
jgi:hypothetical protein